MCLNNVNQFIVIIKEFENVSVFIKYRQIKEKIKRNLKSAKVA